MDVQQVLPPALYAQVWARSQSASWRQRRDRAIALLREWFSSADINPNIPPALWFGYGKDAMAVAVLLNLAGLKTITLSLDNGGDIAGHWEVVKSFDRAVQHEPIWYYTDRPYVEVLADLLQQAKDDGYVLDDDETPLNFFNLGELEEEVAWEVRNKFFMPYTQEQSDVLYLWGNRNDEESARAEETLKHGKLYRIHWGEQTFWRGNPIANWDEIDVWALLLSEDIPVSSIYAMHDLPQIEEDSPSPMPRTLWYPSSDTYTQAFDRWLAHYSPQQHHDLIEHFPEIRDRFPGS